jgi:predicted O-methyltransferase YrrM
MISSKLKLIINYLKYFYSARHRGGHGIHSPFVYNFAVNILFVKDNTEKYKLIQLYKKSLYNSSQILEIEDSGSGSTHFTSNTRRIKDIARNSSTRPKYGKLLARLIAYYKPANVIELGTSLGIGTIYLGINMPQGGKIFTIEADKNLFTIASQYFKNKFSNKIVPINGNFDYELPELISKIDSLDLVYFDGNHRKIPTIQYFELCLKKINENTIFIFDDIHWSSEMEEAWEYIKSHSLTKVCIDLFQIGIVFFRKELSCENYLIRF